MNTSLQWLVWAVVMALVMGAVSRAWRKQVATASEGDLRYPKVILVIALATGLPFVAAGVAALIFAGKDRWVSLVFFGFSTLGGYLLWEYLVVRFTLSPEGLDYRTPFGGKGFARWSDVREVRWSQAAKWFRLTLADGKVVRVSLLVVGLDRLAKVLLEKVPAAADRDATAVLVACAEGRPPSPWG